MRRSGRRGLSSPVHRRHHHRFDGIPPAPRIAAGRRVGGGRLPPYPSRPPPPSLTPDPNPLSNPRDPTSPGPPQRSPFRTDHLQLLCNRRSMARRIGARRLTKLAALDDSPVDVGVATSYGRM